MNAWRDWIGGTQIRHDLCSTALVERLRATIDSTEHDNIAPQGIHFCLCTPDAATDALDCDGHPRRGDFLPPVPLPRRMWAGSTIQFHQPISVGNTIRQTSTIVSIEEKTGATGPLVFIVIEHVTVADEAIAVTEHQTIVYRAAADRRVTPPREQAVMTSAWDWHRTVTPSPPLLFRYSALTFNSHRIHYDLPYAQDEEKYPGLVVHGPLMATLLLDLSARNLAANMLASFSFRGVLPAFSGETLHLVGQSDQNQISMSVLGCDGRTVMTATGTC